MAYSAMLYYEGSPRSFHQNQIELFIMIKGGLLYAQEEVWRLYLHLLCVSAHAHSPLSSSVHSVQSRSNLWLENGTFYTLHRMEH